MMCRLTAYTLPAFLREELRAYTDAMSLRLASWNVRGMPRPGEQLALLADQRPDIVFLQDVSPQGVRAVVDSGLWSSITEPRAPPSSVRRGRCLVAVHGWTLQPLPLPIALASGCAAVQAGLGPCVLTLLSCYAPTNTGPGRAQRPTYFTALAAFLEACAPPVLLGMDANGPRVDHPDPDRCVWWTTEESLVFGRGAATRDSLRLWYDAHPAELRRRIRYYPAGPLEDSYHRGRAGHYLRCRYDSIRVSPGTHIMEVRYLYREAVLAGSDHALVIAEVDE
jgi:hypothetical protein